MTPAGETAYEDSAELVTIGQLVNGRINAPTISVGAVVTFSGTIQRLLHNGTGQTSGLLLTDSTSDALCVRLSARAIADDSESMAPMDTVTIWGTWQAAGSLPNYPSGQTSCPGLVDEVFFSDATSGASDDVG